MIDLDEVKESLFDIVDELLRAYNIENKTVKNAKQIVKIAGIMQQSKVELNPVREIMKNHCHYSYRKLNMYKVNINRDDFKFKRHHFAKFLIDRFKEGFRLINYDESTVS